MNRMENNNILQQQQQKWEKLERKRICGKIQDTSEIFAKQKMSTLIIRAYYADIFIYIYIHTIHAAGNSSH